MHVIRLRRPWEKSREDETGSARIDVPETVTNAADEPATFQYRRRFNLPSGLKPTSRVRLCVDGWQGRLESISINGVALEIGESIVNAEITALLEPHNQNLVRLGGRADQPARLSGEVTLAIEDLPIT